MTGSACHARATHGRTSLELCPQHQAEETTMSRFKKLTHVLWQCHYHLVWVLKYRYRILTGAIGNEVRNCIEVYCSRLSCEITELNVQSDHVHCVEMPPKISISQLIGTVKGRSALRVFTRFPHLRKKPYWGNHFWAKGYCVDTVGLDEEMIRKYVKYQEKQERRQQDLNLD
jgi:putative transposase